MATEDPITGPRMFTRDGLVWANQAWDEWTRQANIDGYYVYMRQAWHEWMTNNPQEYSEFKTSVRETIEQIKGRLK